MGQLVAWILIVMTMERFIPVCFPHQTLINMTKRKLVYILIAVGMFLFLLNCHYFFTYKLRYNSKRENILCDFRASVPDEFRTIYWPAINVAFYSAIPFVAITIMNLGILVKVTYSNIIAKKNLGQARSATVAGSLGALLVTSSLLFLFSTAPIAIFHGFEGVWLSAHHVTTQEQEAYRNLWRSVLENISYFNHSLNFYLYCISGSRFRREFLKMVCPNVCGSIADRDNISTISQSVHSIRHNNTRV